MVLFSLSLKIITCQLTKSFGLTLTCKWTTEILFESYSDLSNFKSCHPFRKTCYHQCVHLMSCWNDYNVSSLRQTCDNRDNTEEGIVLALKWLIGGYRMGHKCKITGEKAVARPCSILLNESQWGKDRKKKKFINWYLLTLSLPSWYVQLTLPCHLLQDF